MSRRHYDKPSRQLHLEDERRHHHEPEAEELAYDVELPEEFLDKGSKDVYPDERAPGELDDEIPEPERILPKKKIDDPEAIKREDLRRY